MGKGVEVYRCEGVEEIAKTRNQKPETKNQSPITNTPVTSQQITITSTKNQKLITNH